MIHEHDIYQQMLDEIEHCNELGRFKIAAHLSENPELSPLKLLELIRKIKHDCRDGIHYYGNDE